MRTYIYIHKYNTSAHDFHIYISTEPCTRGDQESYRDTEMRAVQRRYSRGYGPQQSQAMAHTDVAAGSSYMFVMCPR